MPSSKTITSSDFNVFSANTTIKSAEMNTNFNLNRGHILPMDPSTITTADNTYDLGAADARFINTWGSPVLNQTLTAAPTAAELGWDTTTNKPKYYDGAAWQKMGGGGAGVKSWLEDDNADFEGGTIGDWTTYTDAATSTAVDGSGASATNLAIAADTTSALNGTYSMKVTKSGTANAKGQGIAVDFTIDYVEQGKPQNLPFTIRTDSNFVNSMFKMQVIDVSTTTGSVLNVFTMDGGNGELYATPTEGSKYNGLWTSELSSTSYRLVCHCATSTTTDFSFWLDEVKPGPLSKVSGYNSTNPATFTPTFTNDGGWTFVPSYFEWWREGPILRIKGLVTVNGSGSGTGTITLDLPSDAGSITIGDDTNFGTCIVFDAANDNNFSIHGCAKSGAGIGILENETSAWLTPNDITADSQFRYDVNVLINEWTNSDTMSVHQADLRTLRMECNLDGAQSVVSAANVQVEFDNARIDTHSILDATNKEAVIPAPGDYVVFANIRLTNVASSEAMKVLIRKDNTTTLAASVHHTSNTNESGTQAFYMGTFAKGDIVDVAIDSIADTSYTISTGSTFFLYRLPDFSAFAVQGVYEKVEANSTPETYPITAGQWGDLDSITLSPGTWKMSAQMELLNALGATTYVTPQIGISVDSGNSFTDAIRATNLIRENEENASGDSRHLTLVDYVVTITTETTYYLKARVDTSITNLQDSYKITALRLK